MGSAPSVAVPDTSVVLKWFLHDQEPLRREALALRQAFLQGTLRLVAPDLLAYEVANVLRYKPGWDGERVELAVRSLFALNIEVVPVTPVLLSKAVALAFTFGITVYDAAFAALAIEHGAEFVSADEKLTRCLSSLTNVRSLRAFLSG